jgi:hypothetical protein
MEETHRTRSKIWAKDKQNTSGKTMGAGDLRPKRRRSELILVKRFVKLATIERPNDLRHI